MTNQELLQIYSAYLPYGVKCVAQGYNVDDFSDPVTPKEFELVGISDCKWCEIHEIGRTVTEQSYFKETYLLLRPLSDLTNLIEHNGEKLIPWRELEFGIDKDLDIEIIVGDSEYLYLSYIGLRNEMQKLFEWHFDVFSLIEKGLAINLNDLKDE